MTDSLSLGPTPAGEDCQQVGTANYDPQLARQECTRFRDLLIATFGPPPAGARFKISSNPHDFGTYYDLEIVFNADNETAIDYAYRCESDAPEFWPAADAAGLPWNLRQPDAEGHSNRPSRDTAEGHAATVQRWIDNAN